MMAPCRSAGRQDHRIDGSFVRDRRAGKLVRIRRSGFNVFVADDDVRYLEGAATAVPEGETISIIPAVAGG